MSNSKCKNYVVIVNPFERVGQIVKLNEKYNFVPIIILTKWDNVVFYDGILNTTNKLKEEVPSTIIYVDKKGPEDTAKFLKSKYNVVACVQYESSILFTEILTKELGVVGNNPKTFKWRRDKYLFNERIKKYGIKIPKQILLKKKTSSDILKIFKSYPFVIKPISGLGSVDVSIINNKNDLDSAFKNIKNSIFSKSDFVIQEFIKGDEYVVNFALFNGKAFLTDEWAYKKQEINGRQLYLSIDYLQPTEKYFMILKKYGERVIKASGIKWGSVHLEVKIYKDTPVLIECNWRIAGNHAFLHVPVINKYPAYEIDLFSHWPELPEAKKFFKNYSLNDYNEAIRKVVFIISYKKMKLNKYNIHDSCKKYLKTYFGSSQYLEVGKTIYPTKDLLDCICEVHLMSNDKKLINSDVEILREWEKNDMEKIIS